jgi:hypothetical protein
MSCANVDEFSYDCVVVQSCVMSLVIFTNHDSEPRVRNELIYWISSLNLLLSFIRVHRCLQRAVRTV